MFPPPFESGVLNFIHVNLNLTDELFSVLELALEAELFTFLRLHFLGWQVDTGRSWMLPGLNPWLLLLWELPTADLEKRAALSFFNSKHLSESALCIRFTCTTASRKDDDLTSENTVKNKFERHWRQYAVSPTRNHLPLLIDFSITLLMPTDKFSPFCVHSERLVSV